MHSLLQTAIWGEFKARHGWRTHQLDNQLFLERQLPFGQTFIYAPELDFATTSDLATIIHTAKRVGKERNAFTVRLEFLHEWDSNLARDLKGYGLVKAFEEVQPEWRQWIDISGNPDEILVQMKQKGRYNIRLAEKHGVVVTSETDPAIFYRIFVETAARDGFKIRSLAYYTDLLETLIKNNLGELLVASANHQPLSAAIVSYYDGLASYLYGASSSENRELMAPYFMHWTAIQHAKERNCHTYDLLAVSPQEGSEALRKKYAGITRFKEQFGGQTVHVLGSWDLVMKPLVYTAFKTTETLRRK